MAGRIAVAGSSGSMGRVRMLLKVGVAPIGDSSLDEVTTRLGANTTALGKVKALLEAGPAGAVEDVDALVAIGLPRDLPGGLARVAIHSREEFVKRHVDHANKLKLLVAARSADAPDFVYVFKFFSILDNLTVPILTTRPCA